jgi:hypothetical protein
VSNGDHLLGNKEHFLLHVSIFINTGALFALILSIPATNLTAKFHSGQYTEE